MAAKQPSGKNPSETSKEDEVKEIAIPLQQRIQNYLRNNNKILENISKILENNGKIVYYHNFATIRHHFLDKNTALIEENKQILLGNDQLFLSNEQLDVDKDKIPVIAVENIASKRFNNYARGANILLKERNENLLLNNNLRKEPLTEEKFKSQILKSNEDIVQINDILVTNSSRILGINKRLVDIQMKLLGDSGVEPERVVAFQALPQSP